MKKTWLLDNGHGGEINGQYVTPGKRSPEWEDGTQYFEGIGNRNIVNIIACRLAELGIAHLIITPEQTDLSLKVRVARANAHHKLYPNCVLVSVHSDGFSSESAHGWSVWTSKGETKSDPIATKFMESCKAVFPKEKKRTDSRDGDPDQESQFYILKNTNCPAILTENFFHTNKHECKEILMTEEGVNKIVELHVQAIINVENDTKL